MFDIGVNLTNLLFAEDRDRVITRAFNSGVKGLLLTGSNLLDSKRAQLLSSEYERCWSTVGIHPHESSLWTDSTGYMLWQLALLPKVVAIGECGLDFYRNFSTPHELEKAFIQLLALAAELTMPIFTHCRNAYVKFLNLLDPWIDKIPGTILHCFTGSWQELIECLNRGLYLGITGWVCDERRGLMLRELLPRIPVDRLLVGTDAPYLLPRDLEVRPISCRNEPAYLGHIIKLVAKYRREEIEYLEEETDNNVRHILRVLF